VSAGGDSLAPSFSTPLPLPPSVASATPFADPAGAEAAAVASEPTGQLPLQPVPDPSVSQSVSVGNDSLALPLSTPPLPPPSAPSDDMVDSPSTRLPPLLPP